MKKIKSIKIHIKGYALQVITVAEVEETDVKIESRLLPHVNPQMDEKTARHLADPLLVAQMSALLQLDFSTDEVRLALEDVEVI